MSFSQPNMRKPRLQRSLLAVPGSKPEMIKEALHSSADCIILDCADAVAPKDKVAARSNVIEALCGLDWKAHKKTISVRVNGLDTQYMYRDVIDISEQAGRYLDSMLLPRVGVPSDVSILDCLISQIEYAFDIPNPIGIEALIETTLGMDNIEAIAKASPRLEAMHFGATGFAANDLARKAADRRPNLNYSGGECLANLQSLLAACRAQGLRAIDGLFGDTHDMPGFRKAATSSAALGFKGKWTAHSAQIKVANEVMSALNEETSSTRKIGNARDNARTRIPEVRSGGTVIDIVSARMTRTS